MTDGQLHIHTDQYQQHTELCELNTINPENTAELQCSSSTVKLKLTAYIYTIYFSKNVSFVSHSLALTICSYVLTNIIQ